MVSEGSASNTLSRGTVRPEVTQQIYLVRACSRESGRVKKACNWDEGGMHGRENLTKKLTKKLTSACTNLFEKSIHQILGEIL